MWCACMYILLLLSKYEDDVIWVSGHVSQHMTCIIKRALFFFLLKLLLIAKVMLFDF